MIGRSLLLAALLAAVVPSGGSAHVGGRGGFGGYGGGYRAPAYNYHPAPHYAAPTPHAAPAPRVSTPATGAWHPSYTGGNFTSGAARSGWTPPAAPRSNFTPPAPGGAGGNRTSVAPGGVGNRTGVNTGTINRNTSIGDRTNINTGNIGNRTGVVTGGIGNRTTVNTGNVTNVANRNVNVSNRNVVAGGVGNRTYVNTGSRSVNVANNLSVSAGSVANRNAISNRPWGHSYGWYHGGWGGWRYWPSFWAGTTWGYGAGLASGIAVADGSSIALSAPVGPTIVYANPYYVAVPVPAGSAPDATAYAVPPEEDYSRPIPVPTAQKVDETDEDVPARASRIMDGARAAFFRGEYADASRACDQAIRLLPGDTNLHEFRALCQFARGYYKDASATLYAVLAAGPGWDWNTLSSFYPGVDTYTKQLRALEAYVSSYPKEAGPRFVLAYHYLAMDARDTALAQLEAVEKLQPEDKVAAGLIDALKKDHESRQPSDD